MMDDLSLFYLHEMGIDVYQLRDNPYKQAQIINLNKKLKCNFPTPTDFKNVYLVIIEQSINEQKQTILLNNILQALSLMGVNLITLKGDFQASYIKEYINILKPADIIIFEGEKSTTLQDLKSNIVNLVNLVENPHLKKEVYFDLLTLFSKNFDA